MKRKVFLFLAILSVLAVRGVSEQEKNSETIHPGKVRYIALFVKDLRKTADFFSEKLGFVGERGNRFTLFEVEEGRYFAIMSDKSGETSPGRMVVGFEVEDIDKYFEQVSERGVQPIDPLNDDEPLERPVYREWGAREFGVVCPEGDILMFTRMMTD